MEKSEILQIQCEIGFYGDDENYYVRLDENQSKYDPYFGEGLLFSNFALDVLSRFTDSVHVEMLGSFLLELTPDDLACLAEGRKERCEFNIDKATLEDNRFLLELQYSKDDHKFYLEEKGIWFENDSMAFDAVSAVMILISYLVDRSKHNNGYLEYLSSVANNIGSLYKGQHIDIGKVQKYAFMITFLPYDDFLNNTFIM